MHSHDIDRKGPQHECMTRTLLARLMPRNLAMPKVLQIQAGTAVKEQMMGYSSMYILQQLSYACGMSTRLLRGACLGVLTRHYLVL